MFNPFIQTVYQCKCQKQQRGAVNGVVYVQMGVGVEKRSGCGGNGAAAGRRHRTASIRGTAAGGGHEGNRTVLFYFFISINHKHNERMNGIYLYI